MTTPSLLPILIVVFLMDGSFTAPPKTNEKQVELAKETSLQDNSSKDIYPISNKVRDPLNGAMNWVISSKTASTVDEVVSDMMTLAGEIVEDIGEIMVESIDQLPDTIKILSDIIGTALDIKREKVRIIVKGLRPKDHEVIIKGAVDRINTAVDNSKTQTGWESLEAALATVVGKVIGVTYQNAQEINTAVNYGLRRITDGNDGTHRTDTNEIPDTK